MEERESTILTIKLVGEEHPEMVFEFSEFYKEMFEGHEEMTEAGFKAMKEVMDTMLVVGGTLMFAKMMGGLK